MTGERESTPTVLVVDDEREFADLASVWLAEDYTVRTAYGGPEALERLDGEVDVVLLDRRMPERSGDDVLADIRAQGYDCRVAMVTAVEPDFDIIELGFEDYVTKPVKRGDLVATVERLLELRDADEKVRRLFALSLKRAALEARVSERELRESERYQRLLRDIESLNEDVGGVVTRVEEGAYEAILRGETWDETD